ncbi:Baseplate J-like protein [Fulvimarina pelagi HTCC2506]|uniref:Baseplate J-like protein n=1 Tax=Fulvimarina pelagi HTCC2506 TaxID=314231 RepID=Q0FZ02_9HYPH|nr:baseplate J/gp47 family protein [Fulvimarina pelagi]EAU40156.1 Baseplate J-like protein [Fulvimarina pelagi HTCC2506]
MSRFTTQGLPRPVVVQELDHASLKALRVSDFKAAMAEAGLTWDVENEETDPAKVSLGHAADGDMFFTAMLNDTARVILLPSFASGTDLERHATNAGLGENPRLPGESDPALLERIRLARKSKSAAGPDDYYKSRARNFDSRVRDVAVTAETRNSSDRSLIVSVLTSDNGGYMDAELQAGLTASLNDRLFRSRNVTVEIVQAVITTKNLAAHVYLYPETPESILEQARLNLIDQAAADQRLGFDLTRSYAEKHLHLAGVQRVELQGWVNAYAEFNEAIRLGTVTLTSFRLPS